MVVEYKRQLGFFNPEQVPQPPIEIIGAGGIGSFVAYVIATMGVENIRIWDDDVVEAHNIPNQNFDHSHIGMKKVEAVADVVERKCGLEIERVGCKFTPRHNFVEGSIVILATDSIASRNMVFAKINRDKQPVRLIDGRLGGEMFRVINVDLTVEEDVEYYKDTLFPPEEAMELPCTAKAVIYIAYEIAAIMARQLKFALTDVTKCNREITMDHVGGLIEYDQKPYFSRCASV